MQAKDLGPDVWHGEGIKVLGTQVGSDVFVQSHTNERLEEENRLWEAIGWVPDAVCRATVSSPSQDHASQPSQHCTLPVTTLECGSNEDHLGKTHRGCHTTERG